MVENPRQSRDSLQQLAASRMVIEAVTPEVNAGRFAAKAVAGWPLTVSADVFGDGHEVFAAAVLSRAEGEADWTETRMQALKNDRWQAAVTFETPGPHIFTIRAWRDVWGTWRRDAVKKMAAGQDISVEIEEARLMIAATPAKGADAKELKALAKAMKGKTAVDIAMSDDTDALMRRAGPRANACTYDREIPVWVDREAAAFSAWYELFPRSTGAEGEHGTFRTTIERLPYVKDLGFDVLYFPPIHPIGTTNRKGKNNSLTAGPDDVGSPYAIGSPEGGNSAVHPALGTLDDFDTLIDAAANHGLEIAMDIALNASPDHPWIAEHPDWFERRPDGTIKYAENPPKKYEDIVNFRYYMDDGQPNAPFWQAIRDMFLFWADHGVLCFRVDNPHTKPFPFWEWIIAEVHAQHPGAIFLSEAFTRPKVMKRLAKVGFNQSYSYYTWRNDKAELTEYLTELTTEECRHYMRPNFFVNTPDINPVFLQTSGRPGFRTRAILAASLAGNWGLYSGFELCEAAPLPGREEYLDSEKYELRHRDYDAPGHIKDDVRLINRIRREQPAMRDFTNLKFEVAHDDRVLSYARHDAETGNFIFFHVLIDPFAPAEFTFEIPLWKFGLDDHASIEVEDLINGNRFTWHGKYQTLHLDPESRPYAIWRLIAPGEPR
ncbi:starch synthase (maltosyl-transferring) [Loktanella atrilutea]|uniref:Alpha-1,4-glucan:maltose-1-phosphate maltosyltransferase n=1 Tax=Loktanella atrilutea TaxID=366533 RepID=A0A1M5D664_LOKAT|nr:alpha-1,4-glucan--maltose-1-phosphate maltosyltransferase [Loktanella atrilutea]SHF62529.1 starch synthase (maltosyl-transferring) [Loktanella atrilutea]